MKKRGSFLLVIAVVIVICLAIYIFMDKDLDPDVDSDEKTTESISETTTQPSSEEDVTTESTNGISTQTESGAPDDGAVYNEANGHWYKVYNFKDYGLEEDFNAWQTFCSAKGGYLAVINDASENQFIYNYLLQKGLTVAFFGYTDEYEEGDWTWVHGDSDYENWADGQPNNGANNENNRAENYAQFYKESADGRWNDAPIAENSYRFVCEWGQ